MFVKLNHNFGISLLRMNTFTFMLVLLTCVVFSSMPTQGRYTKMSQCLLFAVSTVIWR